MTSLEKFLAEDLNSLCIPTSRIRSVSFIGHGSTAFSTVKFLDFDNSIRIETVRLLFAPSTSEASLKLVRALDSCGNSVPTYVLELPLSSLLAQPSYLYPAQTLTQTQAEDVPTATSTPSTKPVHVPSKRRFTRKIG